MRIIAVFHIKRSHKNTSTMLKLEDVVSAIGLQGPLSACADIFSLKYLFNRISFTQISQADDDVLIDPKLE